jgi:hypothetical protein
MEDSERRRDFGSRFGDDDEISGKGIEDRRWKMEDGRWIIG